MARNGSPAASRTDRATRPFGCLFAHWRHTGVMTEESPSGPARTLTLWPEYGVDLPVWSPGIGPLDAQELEALGVSRPLIEQLRAWNEGWETHAINNRDPLEFTVGKPMSLQLARQVQAELPDHQIFLTNGPDPRPGNEWPA